jgi:hypothetical protein
MILLRRSLSHRCTGGRSVVEITPSDGPQQNQPDGDEDPNDGSHDPGDPAVLKERIICWIGAADRGSCYVSNRGSDHNDEESREKDERTKESSHDNRGDNASDARSSCWCGPLIARGRDAWLRNRWLQRGVRQRFAESFWP